MMKFCPRCETEKPESEFHKKSNSKDGLNTICKPCNIAKVKEYYRKNREKQSKYYRDRYAINSEPYKTATMKWRAKNPEYAKHHSEWRKKFYVPREIELRIARHAASYGAKGFHTSKEFEKLLRQYNGKCAYCGEKDATDREHVIPLSRGGSNYIGNILPVCRGCNTSKKEKLLVEWRYREDTRFKRWCF